MPTPGRLVRTLIEVLLTRRGLFVPREVLIEALWPVSPPADPVGNIKVLVNRARGVLSSKDLILTGPAGYSFAESADCRVDAEEFLELLERGGREYASDNCVAAHGCLERAIELWRGDPLSEDRYEDWAEEYRQRLNGSFLEALETASAAARVAGVPDAAVKFARLAADREPLREISHLLLAEALGAAGDVAGALRVLSGFRARMAEELGLDPSPAAEDLQIRLLNMETMGPAAVGTGPSEPALGRLPFVGRTAALDHMTGLLAGDGSGVVAVFGRAGLGKTRLLEELASRIPRRVISARAYLAEREDSWAVAASLLSGALSAFPEVAQIPERAAGALADLVPRLEDLRPPESGPVNLESRRALAIQASVGLMERASRQGAVFVVDDLQWADPTSLAVLGLLARRAPGLSLVVAARPPENGSGAGVVEQFLNQLPSPARRIELAGMPLDDLALIIADPDLAALVWKGTDGNPFAVGQLLRTLWEQKMVRRRPDGRWVQSHPDALAAAREALELGERRRLLERIGGLPAGRRRIVEVMALLRREAPSSLLSAAVEMENLALLDHLEALSSAALVILGNHGWRLSHDLLAEAIEADLGISRKGRVHAALAQALADGDADPAEVARHLVGAGDPAAAAAAFAAGAKRRLDRFATEEAETMAGEGLANQPAGDVLAELLETRAEARFRRGALEEARVDLRAAIHARKEGPKRALTLSRLAMLTSGAKDYVHASQLIELALAEAGDDTEARAEALANGANFDLNLGLYDRVEERHTEAMALFRRAGLAAGMARILESRAFTAFVQADFITAEVLLDQVANIFEDAGELLRVANPRCARGLTLAWMNRPEEGLSDIEEALELARLVGDIELEAHVLWFRSQVLAALGRLQEAHANAAETVAIGERMGHRELKVSGLVGQGSALSLMGLLAESEEKLREAIELSAGIPIFKHAAAVRLAPVLIERGDLETAEEYLRQVMQGPALAHCEARLWLATIAHKRRSPDAVAITEEALALARKAGHLASAVKLEGLMRSGSDYAQGLAESSS